MISPAGATGGDRIAALRARCVDVPLPRPIKTGAGNVTSAPLVLIDLQTVDGIVGRSYLFCYSTVALRALRALLEDLESAVVGLPLAPRAVAAMLQGRFRLLGAQGLAGMAAGGIDMAAWDAFAISRHLPLCELLGYERRPVPAYDSLGIMTAPEAIAEGERSLAAGFSALKFKLGGRNARADSDFVAALRYALGNDVDLMVDYNQALDRAEAVRRGKALEPYSLGWIEEPCRADDDASHAWVSAALDTPIQLGENWWSPNEAARAVSAGACDEMMLDVMKIGGVTGWLDASAHAVTGGRRVSSHLFPEISAHLLAASPAAHYLEWLDLASPVLQNPVRPVAGALTPSAAAGVGLVWDERAVTAYQVA